MSLALLEGQSLEHQGASGDTPVPLLEVVLPSGRISPVQGVLEHLPEFPREPLEIGAQLWVVFDCCYGPVQGPDEEGGDDQGHLSPVRPEPGGLEAEVVIALPQEVPTPVELPGEALGQRKAGFGSRSS